MTVAGRPWSRRSASAGDDALLRHCFRRRAAELPVSLHAAADPELRRVSHWSIRRRARSTSGNGLAARARFRGRVLGDFHRLGRERVRPRGAALTLAGVDRPDRRGRSHFLWAVPSTGGSTPLFHARAAASARPQTHPLPWVPARPRALWGCP